MSNESEKGIKSAYELAMERLEDSGRSVVSDEQRRAIADADNEAQAKIAEREIMAQPAIAEARERGDLAAAQGLAEDLRTKINHIREKAEAKKEKIRNAGK